MAAVGVAPLLPGVLPSPARAASSEGAGGFPLLRDGVVVDLFVDQADDPAVARAAGDLQADLERVGGVRPRLLRALPQEASLLVLVGTVGASPATEW